MNLSSYCGPFGGRYTYRPMFTPPGLGFLSVPLRFPAFTKETQRVPVLRTEDHYSMTFFYYAEGCSDSYLLLNRTTTLVAHDRLDAVRRLGGSAAALEYCEHTIERGAARLLPSLLLGHGKHVDLSSVKTWVSGSGCLNDWLDRAMHRAGFDTLVLNYEAPGSSVEPSILHRKTEIIHRGRSFYDDNSQPCRLESHKGCYYCYNSTISRATCHGRLQMLRALPPLPSKLKHHSCNAPCHKCEQTYKKQSKHRFYT